MREAVQVHHGSVRPGWAGWFILGCLLSACVEDGKSPPPLPGPDRSEVPALAFIGEHSAGSAGLFVLPSEPGAQPQLITSFAPRSSDTPSPRLAVSPDGRFIAAAVSALFAPGEIVVVEVATGNKRTLRTGEVRVAAPIAWSPEGSRLAFVSFNTGQDSEIHVLGLSEGSQPIQLTDNTDRELGLTWSPDGQAVRFLREQQVSSTVRRLIPSQVPADGLQGPSGIPDAPVLEIDSTRTVYSGDIMEADQVLSPDGRRISFIQRSFDGFHAQLCILSTQGENCPLGEGRGGVPQHPVFSADSRFIAFSAHGQEWLDLELYVARVDQAGATMLTDVPGNDIRPSFFAEEGP